jgi:MoaA/NifB/PqqE/SkfB family radical SAM enzyme
VNFDREARARESKLEEYEVAARKLAELGSIMISVAGGEPFIRQDLHEIVGIISRWHFPMITTNGWFITEERMKQLWEAGLWGISVSIDFHEAGKHDDARGIKGACERARRGLEIAARTRTQPWQRVNLMCVLNHDNLYEMESLIQLAARHGAYFMTQPYSQIKNGNEEFVPMYKASEHLLGLKAKYRNFLSNPLFLARFDEFYEKGIDGCLAGKAFFNIDNFMNVSKCVEFREEHIGNLLQLEPREIMRRLNEAQRRNTCKACWYNCRGEVESLYSVRGLFASLPTMLRDQTFRGLPPPAHEPAPNHRNSEPAEATPPTSPGQPLVVLQQ